LQTLKNNYEVEFAIPLQLKNIPDDIVITAELPNELKITLKDKGTILLNYMLTQSFYPIVIDFNEYKSKGSHVKIATHNLEKRII
ncbi:MAG: YbbR-like domain-containing protein, partial [Bacteroides sp.]